MEQLSKIGREFAMGSQGGFYQSKDFLDLIKSIGESRSKSEEDRIIQSQIEILKRRLTDPSISRHKMKEFIIRLIYVEMLGHDASFGYIHAVKMTHDENLLLKRTGYLAVTLFLNEDHELIMLIVNTIQKDLRSDNYLVACTALSAVCRLINEETIPAVLGQVVELLGHGKESVRKKAVMVLHRFHQKAPGMVAHLTSNFQKRLCDNDPGVMGATLCPLFDLITADVNSYKDLVTSFVNILKQVAEKRLPRTYDYHQMPAPFIQIKLLKILALLGNGDKQASGQMYTVLGDIFRKGDYSSNIGNAILYECICCVSSIYPNTKLLELAASATSKFLKTDNHNLKYMGIDALSRLIKINPDIAEQHQLAVIDCLEDPDDTLKWKTFELLYKMTKSTNVEVIVDRMIDYMISINDSHYKTEIASRCVELAEQFAPSNQWFIQTMNKVFEYAGDLVNTKVAHNLMRLIAEGFGEDDDSADSQLRSSAVDSYLCIIAEPKLPTVFLQVMCWVLGEYGTEDGKYSASYIIGKLCDVAESHSSDGNVKTYAITGIMKTMAYEIAAGRRVDMLPECQSLIDELSASHSTDLQQRAYELQSLLSLERAAVEIVMPVDASCEDIEVDNNLSFLNNFVQQSIEKGARLHIPESERSSAFNTENLHSQYPQEPSSHTLRFEAYELPKPTITKAPPTSLSPQTTSLVPMPEPTYHKDSHQSQNTVPILDALSANTGAKLRLDGVQQKWGRPSYSSSSSSSSFSSSTPPPSSVSTTNSNPKISNGSMGTKRNQKVEVPAEKQKLAASLFGSSSSKFERKQVNKEVTKVARTKSQELHKEKIPVAVVPSTPQPDLLDLGEPSPPVTSAPSYDPFTQLEGLIGANSASVDSAKEPDLMSLYSNNTRSSGSISRNNNSNSNGNTKKGPSLLDALEKNATARQVGVTPTVNNPNLFRDLLG